MNLLHRWLCASPRWKETVETSILPWVLDGIEVGLNVLEIGPGPGVTTDILRTRVKSLTCIEIDQGLAASLKRRTAGKNVTVEHEDATAMSFTNETFDAAVSFTMLHHVPSPVLQDRLLSEVIRVLRRGGLFVGTDSVYSRFFGLLHIFDTIVIVDPKIFPERLRSVSFVEIDVDVSQNAFRFRARRSHLVEWCQFCLSGRAPHTRHRPPH